MSTRPDPHFASYRYPAEVISTAALLYVRFPPSLRMVEEMLEVRCVAVGYETVRRRGLKFGRDAANLCNLRRGRRPIADGRTARVQTFETWVEVVGARLAA